ncbi:major facilitator superfamily domain-containing protein [Lineolata rhizophorae]|uniref:Major facilitator superfamily domain-containing protein n=1 Tax=Lineolata rhizophorae TaxID=578093 RepID=A0A6A6NYA2_9PEZI|nr:major facilitator superfamily domain-containing protein [Lineolata rhizophorae]
MGESTAVATGTGAGAGRRPSRDSIGAADGRVDASGDQGSEQTPLLRSSSRESDDTLSHHHRHHDDADWSGTAEFSGLPWWKRPSIFWVLGPFFISMLAFGGIIVPKLNLILELICREYTSDRSVSDRDFSTFLAGANDDQCRIPEVQSRVAKFTLYGNVITGVLSAITSPKLGALSDRYGRRKLIFVSVAGTMIGEVITIFAAIYPDTFPINLILLGFAFDGLCGSFICAMAIMHAYATDCTPPSQRNVAFGYFHGCLFTGIAVGPILAGLLVKATGSILTIFYIALGCHVFFVLFTLLVIPESLSKSRQEAAREKYRQMRDALGPAADWLTQIRSFNLLEPLKILYPRGEGSSAAVRRNLVLLSAIDTIIFGVAMGSMTVVVYYTEYVFGFGTYESSVFVSVVNSCRVFCLIVVLPVITRLVRGPAARRHHHHRGKTPGADRFDLAVIRAAIFFDTLGYLGYALAPSGGLFVLAGAVTAVGGLGSPTLQSSLTKHVPADRTGQLLGATGLLHALARVVAPAAFNGIYSATVGKYTPTVFVCLTATFAVAWGCSWFVLPGVSLDGPSERRRRASESSSDESEEDYVETSAGI